VLLSIILKRYKGFGFQSTRPIFCNFSPEVHACTQTSLSCRPRHRLSPILTRIRNVIFRVFALILRRRRVQARKYTRTALYNTYSEAVANCNSIGKHSFRVENSRWGSQRVYINIIYRCYAPVFVCVQSTWQHNICDVASYIQGACSRKLFSKNLRLFLKTEIAYLLIYASTMIYRSLVCQLRYHGTCAYIWKRPNL